MWRKLFDPEILFLIGTIQALFPYILWQSQGLNESYRYEITALPIVIWSIGYFSFWLGARFVRKKKLITLESIQNVSLKKIKLATRITISAIIFQVILAVQVYGILPIYGYTTGEITVSETNDLQRESGFGQFGILSSSLFFLNGLILLLIIKSLKSGQKPSYTFFIAVLVEVIGGLIAGKRQSLFITITFIICGLSVYFNDPAKPFLKFIGLPKSWFLRILIGAGTLALLVYVFGYISSLRTGNIERSGFEEILGYLQLPLINLESQCEQIGIGPYKYNLFYPISSLFPYRLYELVAPPLNELPYRPEPTIGAGFYGSLHWGLGFPGVVFFSFLFGFVSKYFYRKSFNKNIFHLLIYCQISWTLLAAHSYNHFFNLIFLPLPAILFAIACKLFFIPIGSPKTADINKSD